jgi:hypothetical protein
MPDKSIQNVIFLKSCQLFSIITFILLPEHVKYVINDAQLEQK